MTGANPTSRGDHQIVTAGHDLYTWLSQALDLHRHEFGFWTYAAVGDAIDTGRVSVLHENGTPAAFLIRSPSQLIPKIYASFTSEQLRLNDYCRAMVTDAITRLATERCERVRLHTAEDLPANLVWPRLGFTRGRNKGKRNMGSRNLIQWNLVFPRGEQLDSYLEQQTADPQRKKLLALFGLEEQFRAALTKQYRRQTK